MYDNEKSEAATGRAPLIVHAQPVVATGQLVQAQVVTLSQPQQDVETGQFHDGVFGCAAEGCSPCCHAFCCPCFR